jgi:uncharacterized RDD family membrane protein YckC
MRYWLANNDGTTVGPHTLDEIRALAASGSLSPAAQVCPENSTEWLPAAGVLGAAPPTSPQPLSAPPGCCCLCGADSNRKAEKTLYGHPVCKKCYWKFANRRQGAFFIDYICLMVLAYLLGGMLGAVMAIAGASVESMEWTGFILGYAMLIPFFMKDAFGGRSPGRLLCGVAVMNRFTGQPIGPVESLKRNLPLLIPFMILFVAFQLSRGHRVGDGWSRSKVTWKRYKTHPAFGIERAGD